MRPGMTREQMGTLALPKKVYTCGACGATLTHAEARKHWETLCPQRVKAGVRRG